MLIDSVKLLRNLQIEKNKQAIYKSLAPLQQGCVLGLEKAIDKVNEMVLHGKDDMPGSVTPGMPGREFAVVESMTRMEYGCYTIRVWREEAGLDDVRLDTRKEVMREARKNGLDQNKILRAVAALPGVNAVEVVDEDGNGAVVYPTWP